MTNPFTAFAFPTADAGTVGHSRTMPDRLVDFHNVKDFGATGDGVTDDWSAIMDAINWTTSTTNRGRIFFPPGTYVVSAPIVLASATVGNTISFLTGCYGASTIVGNFNDYVITRGVSASSQSFIEKLNIVNNHATGGGIRLGGEGAALRDCNITANIGINTTADDSVDGGSTSLEFTLINCQVNPGIHTSGSIGIVSVANGAISNCRITGYEKGAITWGQQGGHSFQGCYFEGNQFGVYAGLKPNLVTQFDAGSLFVGCWFKNNGTALYLPNSGGQTLMKGVRIDADESVTVYGSRPQYGIQINNALTTFYGVTVSGQYEQAAIAVDNLNTPSGYIGVSAANSSTHGGVPWSIINGAFSKYTGCNATVVPAAGDLVWSALITSVTCSGNTATLHANFSNITNLFGTYNVLISGVPVSGYNGSFAATFTGLSTFTYTIVGGPLASSSGGTAAINVFQLFEGQEFNIGDSETTTWSDNAFGGGSTHAWVRYSGQSLNVVGI